MDTLIDSTTSQIARRIRLEREVRGWSQGDLAERSGVAKASISKIEREEMSPTATLLVRLASAFDLTLAGLLVRAEGGRVRIERAADQPVWCDPATGYKRRQVYARAEHPVELVEVTMPPGRSVTLPAASYARIRQVLWVTDGRLVITEGSERQELGPGDSLGFGPPAETIFANESAHPCTYVVALARN